MTLVAQVDSVKIKEWLSQIKTDAANALLYAVDDGLFANFATTEKVLDVTLDNDATGRRYFPFRLELAFEPATTAIRNCTATAIMTWSF